jgi:hypothetical protein
MHVTPYFPHQVVTLEWLLLHFDLLVVKLLKFKLGKKTLGQPTPFKLSVAGMVLFHPSMNYALCMNEKWLSNAWVCVFLRIATV